MSTGFPTPTISLHLASIDFSPMEFVTEGHRRRADAILLRRTDRLPFAEPPDWERVESQLRSAVTTDAVRLDVIADELRPELAEASQLTESLRLYDSSYHAELSWWTGHYETRDGIPQSSLVSAAEGERVDVGRNFPVTPNTTGASSSVTTTPRSSCCRPTTTNAPACCSAAKCFPPCCLTPRWPGWRRARSPTSPSCGRAENRRVADRADDYTPGTGSRGAGAVDRKRSTPDAAATARRGV